MIENEKQALKMLLEIIREYQIFNIIDLFDFVEENAEQIGYGGLFKEIKKQLQPDDVENGNLVQTSDEQDDLTAGTKIVAYWNATKQNYFVK